MSKKSKTTTASNQAASFNTTTTPTNPEWVSSGLQGMFGDIQKLGQTDPQSYVAGPDPLQTQAAQGAGQLGTDRGWLEQVTNPNRPQVQGQSLLTNLEAYMSPYRDRVVNAATADFDANAGKTRAQQNLDIAGQGAFGGSGAAITKSLTEGELARARETGLSTLLDQMFNTGASLSSQDADRRQSAQTTNAGNDLQYRNLAGTYGLGAEASDRANVGVQGDLGAALQAISQNKAQAPLSLQALLTQLGSSLPLNLFSGENSSGTSSGTANGTSTTKTSDPLGTAAKIAQMAAMFSDARLKTNIETDGYDARGRRWARYEYVWEPGVTRRGVIAQEVLKTDPHAVIEGPAGFLMVDYAKLEA